MEIGSRLTQPPHGARQWVLVGLAEAVALVVAWGLWAGGIVVAPGLGSPDTSGDLVGVVVFEVAAALVCLVVPAGLVRGTGRRAWWLLGVPLALFALGTAVALLSGW